MAQSRQRRQQRVKRRSDRTVVDRLGPNARTVRLRRIVIAFLILVGLAGILALSPSGDETGLPGARPVRLTPPNAIEGDG